MNLANLFKSHFFPWDSGFRLTKDEQKTKTIHTFSFRNSRGWSLTSCKKMKALLYFKCSKLLLVFFFLPSSSLLPPLSSLLPPLSSLLSPPFSLSSFSPSSPQVELALRVQLDYLEPMAFSASGPSGTVERDAQTYRWVMTRWNTRQIHICTMYKTSNGIFTLNATILNLGIAVLSTSKCNQFLWCESYYHYWSFSTR